MKTTLQQIANVYSGVAGGRRVLVALFEYVKPDGTALAAEEIETILDAANAAASELGAEICWRATNGEIATPTLGMYLALSWRTVFPLYVTLPANEKYAPRSNRIFATVLSEL